MAKVELHIHLRASSKVPSKRTFVSEEITRGETPGALLARLANGNNEACQQIFDAQTNQMQPAIVTILNGTPVPPEAK